MLVKRFQAFASEVLMDPVHELVGRQRPLRLDDRPLAVQPPRLDRIEPGALHRQPTHQDPDPAGALHRAVMRPNPRPHRSADVPGGVVPHQHPYALALRVEPAGPQARKSVVTRLTGRPSTKRSSTRSWSVRNSP